MLQAIQKHLIDLAPLRQHETYRRLWICSFLSSIGNHITLFAVTLQIYQLTRSAFAVGAIGLFTGVPAIALALWGGSLGDSMDRRRIVLACTALQAAICAILLVQAVVELESVALLYGLVAAQFLLGSINVPAASAIVPRLIGKEQLQAAAALRMFSMHLTMVLGPLVGGLLASRFGTPLLYAVDLLSFAAALYGILRLPSIGPKQAGAARTWASVVAGFAFVVRTPMVSGALLVDFALAFFGVANALFPAINDQRFSGNAEVLGLMYAAPALGGIVATALSGSLHRLGSYATAMTALCILWGASVAVFGTIPWLWPTLAALLVIGALDSLVAVLRSSIVQAATSDEFRGRVSSVEYVVGNAAPQLGNVRAGALASLSSPEVSAIIGGLCTVCAAFAVRWIVPGFAKPAESAQPGK
jgi:MFS family permease